MKAGPLAHSLPPPRAGELLSDHLARVSAASALRGRWVGLEPVARAAGALHDIGKASAAFQAYIRGQGTSPDHSTAGAVEAKLYGGAAARALAYVIAGHHAGLADGHDLNRRLGRGDLPPYDGWRDHVELPARADVEAGLAGLSPNPAKGFAEAFRIRMLFSCLVDADFTETARFYAQNEDPPRDLPPPLPDLTSQVGELLTRLAAHLKKLPVSEGAVDRLRAEVLAHAREKAALDPGLFTLTVPTGGGKTLTSLAFALEHARRHGRRRVVYVIPYTSIIEQTAEVFRQALERPGEEIVLEHHSSFDWEEAEAKAARAARAEGLQDDDGLARLRRASEAWDAPVIVTTAVQFFESLFANRTSRCRKLHNLAGAVIVLDEAQTLPLPLLRPCLAALDELARNYRSSVVLCTATQPAVRVQDGALVEENRAGQRTAHGLAIGPDRELAPDPPALYAELKRVDVTVLPGETDDAAIAARFERSRQMLCIVNSRAHARALFESIQALDGAVHLSTLMCPVHRSHELAKVREALKQNGPARVVSTSLIEAGVDISFPEVWRASTGLDSIAHGGADRNRPQPRLIHERPVAPSRGRGSKRVQAGGDHQCRGVAPSRGRGSKPRSPLELPHACPSPPHGGADRNN